MNLKAFTPVSSSTTKIHLIKELAQKNFPKLSSAQFSYLEQALKHNPWASIANYPHFTIAVKISEEGHEQLLEKLRVNANQIAKFLNTEKLTEVSVHASNIQHSLAFSEGLALGNYQFLRYYSDAAKKENTLKEVQIEGASPNELSSLQAVINGTFLARNLVNEPLSFLTATELANTAKKEGAEHGFSVEVFNKKKIESLKMGGLLAVNKGSQDPPTFTIMEYKSAEAKNSKPIVLVGKGVVYDTGGMSLKPTAGSMDSMKSDMAGAAAVIGTMSAIAQAKLPVHVIALVPATDNRPGENAYVPGDVITMFDGSTVEVLNTDAEGRMLLADALAYAKKLDPQLVIDLATLTGAAAIAIGKYGVVGMGTASDVVFSELDQAGKNVFERLARFPFWDEYSELLKSPIADMKNIGGREAGAITAGKFLEHFTNYPWVHLDIAGPAFLNADHDYRPQGGTGVGVRLLFNFLSNTPSS